MIGIPATIFTGEPLIGESSAAPIFSSHSINPDPVEVGEDATIQCHAYNVYGDDLDVNAKITLTDGASTYSMWVHLTKVATNLYNATIPGSFFNMSTDAPTTTWDYEISAEDSYGNTTEPTEPFTVVDTNAPDVGRVETDGYCVGEYYNATAEVTDPSGIAEVDFLFTGNYGAGSWNRSATQIGTTDTWYYERGVDWTCGDIGNWLNLTAVVAQDTEGNWVTLDVGDNNTVEDCEDPTIGDVNLATGDMCYETAWANVTVTADDNCVVDTVKLDYTNATGGSHTVTMTQVGTTTYYYNFTGFTVDDVGTWTLDNVEVTDVNRNSNSTDSRLDFDVLDCNLPEITLHQCWFKIEDGWDAVLNATVTDDDAVEQVYITIVWDEDEDGTIDEVVVWNETMTDVHGTWTYTYTPDAGAYGDYYYYVKAVDINGNWNQTYPVNDTDACYFEVVDEIVDSTPPSIYLGEGPEGDISVGGDCEHEAFFEAEVTDDVAVNNVEVWLSGDVTGHYTMIATGPSRYGTHVTLGPGDYTYRIHAWDTVGNEGIYPPTSQPALEFSIVDDTPPTITDNSPATGTTGDDYTFDVGVSDNCCDRDDFTVTVEWSHGSLGGTETMTYDSGRDPSYWIKTVTLDDSTEDMTYTITVEDSHGQVAEVDGTVTVSDNDDPTVDDITGDTTACTGDTVTINAVFGDNIAIDYATLYYRKATASTWLDTDITDGTADISIDLTDVTDIYYYIQVFDTSGNDVLDPTGAPWSYYTIDVSDCVAPEVTEVTDTPDPQEIGNDVTITATVTDNIEVGTVWVYIEEPAENGGTTASDSATTFEKHEMTADGDTYTYTYSTSDDRDVRYYIEAVDTSGNYGYSSIDGQTLYGTMHFVAPIDVDVTKLVKPDPSRKHATSPQEVWVNVTNNGLKTAEDIDLHLQIYEEKHFDPQLMWDDHMESSCYNWTAEDLDGDGVSWGWTELRASSPTHSWHNVQDSVMEDQGTYVGNSHDILTSRPIPITSICPDGDKPTMLWLDFQQWLQGEISQDQGKFEDYGTVYYRLDDGEWIPLARYGHSGGVWVNSDPQASESQVMGQYDYDVAGNPIGWRINPGDADTIQIRFEWQSDPGTQFEGWYIDDVSLTGQCGVLQPLVHQEYKFLDSLEPGETKLVAFPFEFTPKDDTWYFYEVYSTVGGDVDGVGDNNYDTKQKTLGGPLANPRTVTYRDPWNGVNESIYFGDLHDGAAVNVYFGEDGNVINELNKEPGETAQVPISYQVKNNGTLTEEIPYQIEVKETLIGPVFPSDGVEDFEDGDQAYYEDQGWEVGYFENPDAVPIHLETDMAGRAHSGTNFWYFGDPTCAGCGEGYYCNNMYNAFRTPEIDMSDYVGKTTTHLNYWVNYNIDDTLGPSPGYTGGLDPGYSDKWYFGLITSDGTYLFLSTTATSGTSNGWKLVESTNTPGEISGYNAAHPDDPWYPIDVTNPEGTGLVSWLQDIGYGDGQHIAFFWGFASGETDVTYEDEPWSGLMVDDVQLWKSGTGETIWSSDMMSEKLQPGEVSEEQTIYWPAEDYCDYTATLTTHVENDWNTPLKGHPELGNYYNDEATSGNLYLHTDLYEEDFESTGAGEQPGTLGDEWTTHDNTFGGTGHWEIVSDNAPGWQENHYVWTGEGPGLSESDYGPGMNEVLVPATDDGGVKTFDLTDKNAVEMRFDLWNEIETSWDYLTLEISNDSGDNWWTIAHWNNLTNSAANMETWLDIAIELFNGTDTIQAWDLYAPAAPGWIGSYGGVPIPPVDYTDTYNMVDVGITDEMTFRFHIQSDGAYQVKGAYIDNVELVSMTNTTIPYDGTDQNWEWTKTTLFEDDFENGLDKWLNTQPWTGSMWHVSDTCSYTGDYSAANFDPIPWSSNNKQLGPAAVNLTLLGPDYWFYQFADYYDYDHSYMNYRNNADDKLIASIDLSGVYQAYLRYYVNYSFAAGDKVVVEISTDEGATWKQVNEHTGPSSGWTTQTSSPPLGYTTNYGLDISGYTGDEILIRWRLLSNEAGTDDGIQIDDILIVGKKDTRAPVTTATLTPGTPNGDNGWYTSAVTVTLTAQDREMGTTYYRINGGSWLTYTGQIQIDDDGEYTIDYYSVDAVGNEETPKSVSFKIDSSNPSGSLDFPQTGYIYLFGNELMPRILFKDKALIIGGLTATASASDAMSGVAYVTFETSQGTSEDAVSPYEFNLPFYFPSGTDTVTISATDQAGNTAAEVGSVAYLKIL